MKATKFLIMFSAMGLGLAAVGCDSTSGCTDAGVCPDVAAAGGSSGQGGTSGTGGAGGAGITFYNLSDGTYCYDIVAATPGTDGCALVIPSYVGMQIPVTYASATGMVTVGTMGALGAGPIDQNKGTLKRENSPVDPMMPSCSWHQTDDTMFELIANFKFTASVIETESMFAAACSDLPPTDPCTSAFTFTLSAHIPASMPSAATGLCGGP